MTLVKRLLCREGLLCRKVNRKSLKLYASEENILRVSNPLKRHDIMEMSRLRPSNLIKFIQALIGSILFALRRMNTLPGVRNYVLITFDTSLDNVYSKRNELAPSSFRITFFQKRLYLKGCTKGGHWTYHAFKTAGKSTRPRLSKMA